MVIIYRCIEVLNFYTHLLIFSTYFIVDLFVSWITKFTELYRQTLRNIVEYYDFSPLTIVFTNAITSTESKSSRQREKVPQNKNLLFRPLIHWYWSKIVVSRCFRLVSVEVTIKGQRKTVYSVIFLKISSLLWSCFHRPVAKNKFWTKPQQGLSQRRTLKSIKSRQIRGISKTPFHLFSR